ncbi:SsrA-binding protein SmpB [Candidatus Puniceispirillum sp.]|nr:SsrA-binding protein SmpB [Candidatus Puniceispirillum sp.]
MAKGIISTGRIAENRKARHEYEIEEKLEAGLILLGSEVKSLRSGRVSIAESYAGDDKGRLMLFNANIPIYEPARANHEPKRPRELLVKARERNRMLGLIRREGMTLVPLAIYFNDRGVAKIQIGLAKGRKKQDKRQADKDRTWSRDKARLLNTRNN